MNSEGLFLLHSTLMIYRPETGVLPIGKKKVDWHRVKGEYIAGGISQRDLAKKHKIPWSTLQKRAAREGWTAQRTDACAIVVEKVVQETAQKKADNATLAADIKRKGLIILDSLFDDFAAVRATEHRESKDGITDIKRLRDLTQAFRDLTDDDKASESQSNELLQSLLDLERRSDK